VFARRHFLTCYNFLPPAPLPPPYQSLIIRLFFANLLWFYNSVRYPSTPPFLGSPVRTSSPGVDGCFVYPFLLTHTQRAARTPVQSQQTHLRSGTAVLKESNSPPTSLPRFLCAAPFQLVRRFDLFFSSFLFRMRQSSLYSFSLLLRRICHLGPFISPASPSTSPPAQNMIPDQHFLCFFFFLFRTSKPIAPPDVQPQKIEQPFAG